MRDIAEKKKWCQEEATGWCRAGTSTARYMLEACMKKQTSETAVQYIYRLSSLDVFCFLKKARFFVQVWSWGCFWEVWTSEECLGGSKATWVWLRRDGSKAGCWGSGRQDHIAVRGLINFGTVHNVHCKSLFLGHPGWDQGGRSKDKGGIPWILTISLLNMTPKHCFIF